MTTYPRGVAGGACRRITDDAYPSTLLSLIRSARCRVLCSVFIVDTRGAHPVFTSLLDALEERVWAGLDVRVVVGGSRETYAIAESAAQSRAVLLGRGVPCRWLTARPGRRGSHAKLVVADDRVLLGSHNWSPGAFGGQLQDSVLLDSPALAAHAAAWAVRQWNRAGT